MNQFNEDLLPGFDHLDDQVDHPSHYRAGHIECIDYISDFLTDPDYIGYLRGSVENIYTVGHTKMVTKI